MIYADPPWAFKAYGGQDQLPSRSPEPHYDAMALKALQAIPVRMVAERDAVLHMWAVSSHVDQAVALGEAWGFHLNSLGFIWVKTDKQGRPKMSMGHWTRQQAEICLLFTRGKPKRISRGVRQVILERPREHSRKPDGVRERIMALSRGPYLELFTRVETPGWANWGDQVGRFTPAADVP